MNSRRKTQKTYKKEKGQIGSAARRARNEVNTKTSTSPFIIFYVYIDGDVDAEKLICLN